MNEIECINITLKFLYSVKNGISSPTLDNFFVEKNINQPIGSLQILLRLQNEGLADLILPNPDGFGKNIFMISSKGSELIETLPEDFKHKPYSYKVKLDSAENEKISFKEDLENRKLKVDLANAEKTLKSYPYTQFIAWAAFIFAAIQLFLSIAKEVGIWPYHK